MEVEGDAIEVHESSTQEQDNEDGGGRSQMWASGWFRG